MRLNNQPPRLTAALGTTLFATLTACEHRNADGTCVAPLGAYHAERPSIDEARACAADTATRFHEYSCQGLTIIECFGTYGGDAFYYDADGTLVAVRAATDTYAYCTSVLDTGSTEIWLGELPPEACR